MTVSPLVAVNLSPPIPLSISDFSVLPYVPGLRGFIVPNLQFHSVEIRSGRN